MIKLRNGGVATVAVPYLPSNFNPSTPAGANQVTQMVMEQVWPRTVVIDPSFNAVPTSLFDSAELVSISPQTVDYKIAAAAVWSDGTPLTAGDLIYNWHEQVASAASLPFSGVLAGYRDIASITASEKGKLATVVFRHPFAEWEGLFSNIVPAHIAQQIGWGGFDVAHVADVVSAGPYFIASSVPGQELILRRNKRWWGSAPHLDEIVFRVVSGEAAVWNDLERGSVEVAVVDTRPSVAAQADAHGLTASTTLSPVLWQVCFNLADAVVGRSIVRRAIAASLDRVQLVDDTVGLLDPGMPVAENRLFLDGAPGADVSAAQFSITNLVAAAALMRRAGYTLASNGYYTAAGSPLVLTVEAPSGVPLVAAVESVLGAEMKDAGIAVVFDNIPLSKLLGSRLPNSSFEMALVPYYVPVYQSWTSPLYGPPARNVATSGGGAAVGPLRGSSAGRRTVPPAATSPVSAAAAEAAVHAGFVTGNVCGLTDHDVGSLYNEASAQLDQPTARGLYNEINTLLWADLPTIPLFQEPVTVVSARNLLNVSESPTWSGVMWNAQDWGIAQNLPPVTTTSG